MLYADLNPRNFPPGWEEAEYLAKMLKQISWHHQLVVRKKMFAVPDGPEYKFTIIRWGIRRDINSEVPRTELWEGSDYAELTGMLRLLIATETAQAQESNQLTMLGV